MNQICIYFPKKTWWFSIGDLQSQTFLSFRFTFPGVFIFYQMLSSLVYGVVFLLNYIDFTALLCRSRNLVESLMPGNETPLCILSGESMHLNFMSIL